MATILTNAGRSKLLAATPMVPVTLSAIAFGDGSGSIPAVVPTRTSLVNERLRVDCSFPVVDTADPTVIMVSGSIPRTFGGVTLREVGLYDNTGVLIAYGSINNEVLPAPVTEYGYTYTATFRVKLDNASMVTVINSDAPSLDHRGLTYREEPNAHPATAIYTTGGRTVQEMFTLSKVLTTTATLIAGEDNYITTNNTFTLPSTTGLANGTRVVCRRKRDVIPTITVSNTATEQIVVGKDDLIYAEYDSVKYNILASIVFILDSATKRWEMQ
jgi:hypothetical protein